MSDAPIELIAHGDGWSNVEYIRADALRAKLGGYHDSDLLSLAESLRTFHDNAEATMEAMQAQLDAANKRNTEYVARQIRYLEIEVKLANARIAELEAAQQWVSVDERLPDPLVDVVVTDGESMTVGWSSKKGWWYANGWSDEGITHWMPLPPPPQA